jgi:uncharacterized membrane protein HdeD (DUF308 family)
LLLAAAALWVIVRLVGIDMVFAGWSWIMMALAVRSVPSQASEPRE